MIKRPIILILLSFFSFAEDFKSWEAKFTFNHHRFGAFDMERDFVMKSSNKASSSFILRPLLIFEYSQTSNFQIEDSEVFSLVTEVTNNVPGVNPSYFKVRFKNNSATSKELNLNIKRDKKILDQLGSDLQMRFNAKNGIKDFKLLVIDNDEGDVVERNYKTLGTKLIKTNFGQYECIEISATSMDGGRIVYFISPDLDFMIVKSFVELKNGKVNTLTLKERPKFLAK